MVERFTGSGNKRGQLKHPKTNTYPARVSVETPSDQITTYGGFKKFIPLGLPIEESDSQKVKPHTNSVGCPPTPGYIVIPTTKK